jgi:hypothetical protein
VPFVSNPNEAGLLKKVAGTELPYVLVKFAVILIGLHVMKEPTVNG